MAIKPNKRYTGTVTGGQLFESRLNLTPGYQVFIDCEDGQTDYIIWLTPGNRKNMTRSFKVLGADMERMSSKSYLLNELAGVITGKEVTFEAKEEEYKGEVKVKVAWIGKVSAASEDELAGSVAALFGTAAKFNGGHDPIDGAGDSSVVDDSDIPF